MTRGGQAAVFDVSDLTAPRRVATHGYGRKRQTRAGPDPRQFTWLADRRTALTVVGSGATPAAPAAWISVLEVGADGALTTGGCPATYGYDDVAHAAHRARCPTAGWCWRRENDASSWTCDGLSPRGVPSRHVPQHPPAPQLRAARHA